MKANPDHDHGPPTITVLVYVPSQIEPRSFTWPKTLRVGDAAREVADVFGLSVENPTLQNKDGEALDRDKPLVAAGVRDGDRLDLIDAGGGVLTVPRDTTLAAVEVELPALMAYGERHGWKIDWVPDQLRLNCAHAHSADGSPLRLCADLTGYRAIPPAWSIEPVEGGTVRRLPIPHGIVPGQSSIFHSGCDICAPFNRRAFSENGGPHNDWGGASRWLEVRTVVQGRTLADMIAVITAHLRASPGWQK